MTTTVKSNPIRPHSATTTSTTLLDGVTRMQAMVCAGPGQIEPRDCPKPVFMAPGDEIVRITQTTICGTDLKILKGDVPTATPGRILGHEGLGVINASELSPCRPDAGDRDVV